MAAIEYLNPVGQGDANTWGSYGPGANGPKYTRLADRGAADADADGILAPYPGNPTQYDTYYFAPLTQARNTDNIVRVTLHLRAGVTLNTTAPVLYPRARRNGVNTDLPGVPLTPGTSAGQVTWSERAVDFTSYRPEGGAWEITDFGPGPSTGQVQFGIAAAYQDGGAWQPTLVWLQLEVVYQPVGVLLPVIRRSASTSAWRLRRAPQRVSLTVPPTFGGLDLAQHVHLSDPLGPSPDGRGWKANPDDARHAQVRELTEDLAAFTLGVTGVLVRPHLVSLADSGRILGTGDVRTADGLLRLDPAVNDIFLCSSKRWVQGPDGLVAEIAIDDPSIDHQGRLHEGGAVNDVCYSAFQAGADSLWTRSGGADYVNDAPLFEARVGARILETAGPGLACQTRIALPLGTTVLSLDYRTVGPQPAAVIIQREDDGQHYNAAADAWQAAAVTITLPASEACTRSVVRITNTEADTTYTLSLVNGDPGGAGARWYHVQSERARRGRGWPSSRIVTLATPGERAHTYLATPNNTGARTYPARDGSYRLRYTPAFDADDVAAAGAPPVVLWRVAYAADQARLAFLPATAPGNPGVLEFRRLIAGGATAVTLPLQLVAGQSVRIACRWQSRSQHGAAPGTLGLWCEGLSASTVGAHQVAETSPAWLVRGSTSDTDDGTHAEGWCSEEVVAPVVFADSEWEEVW